MVQVLGVSVSGSDDEIVNNLLAAIERSEDATAAAGDLFPDLAMSDAATSEGFDEDDEDDDFAAEDDYMARRRARSSQNQ